MELKKQITLEKLVNQMLEQPNHNPRDYCFKYIVNNYPRAVHDAFDFPGEYADNLELEVYTEDGRKLKMDCAQLVMPKGDITCKSTINVEHQTYPIKEKIGSIYDYKLYLIHKTNIPSNSIVMTNIDLGKDEICCKSHDQIFKLRIIVVTAEKISKRLKILTDKVQHKKGLSQKEAMYFAYVAIFLRPHCSKETMEKLCELFSHINQFEPNLELVLHQILKKMIKTEIWLKEKDLEFKEKLEEKDLEFEEKLEKKDLEFEEKLEEKDLKLKEVEKENKKLKHENEMLKKQIKG